MQTQNRLKMKDLERRTGVGREAIRFYIKQGLLPEPERPARNVAWYSEEFVERIRLIKELQEKRFLPLNVIKSILASDAIPPLDHVQALTDLDGRIGARTRDAEERAPERVSDVAKRTGLAAKELRELAAIGVLEIVMRDGGQWLDVDSVSIAERWAEMRRLGFTEERGFSGRVLRLHVDFVEWLAREELRIFSAGIVGKVPTEEAARMAEAGIEQINGMLPALRRRTLLKYIAEGNIPADATDAYPTSHPKAS